MRLVKLPIVEEVGRRFDLLNQGLRLCLRLLVGSVAVHGVKGAYGCVVNGRNRILVGIKIKHDIVAGVDILKTLLMTLVVRKGVLDGTKRWFL